MITFDLEKFLHTLEAGRIVAIDPGRRSIGVAFSDPDLKYIQNYFQFTSQGRSADAYHIFDAVPDFSGVVVGTPFSHTRNNNWLPFIDKFSQKLHEISKKPVLMHDESSSTVDAMFLLGSFSRARQRKWKDKIAACCILETILCTIVHYRLCKKDNPGSE